MSSDRKYVGQHGAVFGNVALAAPALLEATTMATLLSLLNRQRQCISMFNGVSYSLRNGSYAWHTASWLGHARQQGVSINHCHSPPGVSIHHCHSHSIHTGAVAEVRARTGVFASETATYRHRRKHRCSLHTGAAAAQIDAGPAVAAKVVPEQSTVAAESGVHVCSFLLSSSFDLKRLKPRFKDVLLAQGNDYLVIGFRPTNGHLIRTEPQPHLHVGLSPPAALTSPPGMRRAPVC